MYVITLCEDSPYALPLATTCPQAQRALAHFRAVCRIADALRGRLVPGVADAPMPAFRVTLTLGDTTVCTHENGVTTFAPAPPHDVHTALRAEEDMHTLVAEVARLIGGEVR